MENNSINSFVGKCGDYDSMDSLKNFSQKQCIHDNTPASGYGLSQRENNTWKDEITFSGILRWPRRKTSASVATARVSILSRSKEILLCIWKEHKILNFPLSNRGLTWLVCCRWRRHNAYIRAFYQANIKFVHLFDWQDFLKAKAMKLFVRKIV